MKRIIILLFLISYIFCSRESCIGEKDYDKCSIHDIENKGFACYTFNIGGNKVCNFYPDSSESQKEIFRFRNGLSKEAASLSEYKGDVYLTLFDSEKESYNKGEEIVMINKELSEEDIKIIKGKKTCRYLIFWKIL